LSLNEEYFELEREKFRIEQTLRQAEVGDFNFSQTNITDRKQIHQLDVRLGNYS